MRTIEPLERRQLLAWNPYASLIGQDTLAITRPTLTGKGQVVAVIDTGIDYTHPDLGGGIGKKKKIIAAYDFIQVDSDPQDTDGHGTGVASFVAGNQFTYEGDTYRGIAPDAKLIALRVGTGRNFYEQQNIIDALNWVVNNRDKYGITVVNISIAGKDESFTDYVSSRYSEPLAKLKEMGVFVVVASGNQGFSSLAYPAADPSVFSVGSVGPGPAISGFTQRAAILDVLAPGEQVLGATPSDGGYELMDGTSFATPITAGAVALIKQAAPTLSVDDIASVIRSSSVANRDGDNEFFPATSRVYGQLNLVAAINLAEARAQASLSALATSKHTTMDSVYDKSNILHMAYYEPKTRRLMYSVRADSGKWTTPVSVDTSGAEVGQNLSLEIDQAGRPAIAYYDATNADLKYATLTQGTVWTTRVIDSKKSTGQNPSLIFNSIGEPNIAYHSKSTGRLRFASYDWETDKWSINTIDGSSKSVGLHASMSQTPSGSIGVAYADQANGNLKFAYPNGSTWTTTVVDDLKAVGSIDLTYDGVEPLIAYQDQEKADVKYAWVRDRKWKNTTLVASANVGKNIKSYFDADGAYHVVYYNIDRTGTYDALVRVKKQVVSVVSTDRVGTIGQTASVAASREGAVTLVGLNRGGGEMSATELVDSTV